MAAQQPGIAQIEDGRDAFRQLRQRPKIEVAAVEVVAMKDVGRVRREIQQIVGSRKREIFDPQLLVHPAYGLAAVAQ